MTVKVQTTDYVSHTHPEAALFSEYGGVLALEAEDGTDVAIFAAGQWVFASIVSEDEAPETPVEDAPRVWLNFNDIPDGVQVRDKDGDRWTGSNYDNSQRDHWGPFTEVTW